MSAADSIFYLNLSICRKKYIAAAISIIPMVPYIHRAPLRPNFFTKKRQLSAVKNHSQLNNDANSAIAPVNRNIACTMLWSIIFPLLLWCPALCLQLHLGTIACDEGKAHRVAHNVSDYTYILHCGNLLMVGNGDCEQQFIILASTKSAGDDIEVQLLGHNGSLVVNGDALLVDSATHPALLAYVHQLRCKAVAYVHH